MTPHRTLLFPIVLATGLAVGFVAGRRFGLAERTRAQTPSGQSATQPHLQPASASAEAPPAQRTESSAEPRSFEQLKAALWAAADRMGSAGSLAASDQLDDLAHTVKPEDFGRLLAAVDGEANVRKRRLLREALLARWGAVAPTAALDYALKLEPSAERNAAVSQVVGIWAEADLGQLRLRSKSSPIASCGGNCSDSRSCR